MKTRLPMEDGNGLAGKPGSWITNPSKYILMHEPPAGSFGCAVGLGESKENPEDMQYHFWHFSDDRHPDIARHDFINEGRHFRSPLLFVDGHSAFFDFTKAIRADPMYFCEPTSDWVWYKPMPGVTNLSVN
jgi:hypothetical protein